MKEVGQCAAAREDLFGLLFSVAHTRSFRLFTFISAETSPGETGIFGTAGIACASKFFDGWFRLDPNSSNQMVAATTLLSRAVHCDSSYHTAAAAMTHYSSPLKTSMIDRCCCRVLATTVLSDSLFFSNTSQSTHS
jgi:hypothetical protein